MCSVLSCPHLPQNALNYRLSLIEILTFRKDCLCIILTSFWSNFLHCLYVIHQIQQRNERHRLNDSLIKTWNFLENCTGSLLNGTFDLVWVLIRQGCDFEVIDFGLKKKVMFNDLQVPNASPDPFQYEASKYLTDQCLIKERDFS